MHFSGILLLLIALGLYCNVLARPLEAFYDEVQCQVDDNRGLCPGLGIRSPGTFKPPIPGPKNDPQPAIGRPGSPGSPSPGAGTGAGSSSGPKPIGVPAFVAPPSYGVFPQKGQQLVDDLARATGPDVDHDYATKSMFYKFFPDTLASPFAGDSGNVGKNIRAPFDAVGLKDNSAWTLRSINGKDWEEEETNVVYHNKDQQSLVITDTFNDRLGKGFEPQNKLFHSELVFQGWKVAPGGNVADLKNVVVAQVQNDDTRLIIKDARTSITKTPIAGQEVTFTAAAQNDAELQGFFALAGTENGKLVFRMLADHHNEMNGRKVVAVHTWDDLPDTPDPVLIWQLG